MIDNDLDDEIIIGINRPEKNSKNKVSNKNAGKKTNKNSSKNSNNNKKVVKKATSKNVKKEDKNKKSKNKKKNDKPKSKKGLVVFLIILVIAGIISFLLTSSLFKINEVEIVNNSKVTLESIKEIVNFDNYRNIFWVNTFAVEKEIEANNAYIESVKVSRKLPNTVVIDVKERTPKYMLQIADSFVYINNQGYMLEVSTENIGLPIILGFKTDLSNIEVGKRLDVEDLKKMQNIIKIVQTANVNEVGEYITKIDISDERNYCLVLEGLQKNVYLGDCSDLNTKMLYLNGILELYKDTPGDIFLNMDLNSEKAYFRERT